ncbi:MAG: tRNA (adenosine(37)-N6)-threonylcarbamoyltransferase complex transferase subunit TsaD [Clostridiales bacterium]|nr:tRNA (adenosine(37)-N6)-threonylcarbamoyltransferase complex transferase subunit TsaD [Clostridiales bacterium]
MTAYSEQVLEKADELRKNGPGLILGIESSCDETAAAVLRGRFVLGTAVHTQIPVHRLYGGVVPEIASRSHTERIGSVVRQALENAGVTLDDIDAVAVTYRPGLIGALLVGVSYAKGLAYANGLPLVGVDHITGHIAANYITYPDLEPPFMCIVASGGHSHIVRVNSYTDFTLIGRTRDDAAGEAFDKVARAMGLPYPGGPELEKLAKDGDPNAFPLHTAFNEGESFDFSFSGLKTAVVNIMHNAGQKGESVNKADLAASFQRAVTDALTRKSVRAAREAGLGTLALAGGVSANTALRERLQRECDRNGIRFCRPDMKYCTDNAAMIACQGHYELLAHDPSPLSLDPNAASFLQMQ